MIHKKFMDIERIKENYADGFHKGDNIIIQEKIDGANCAIRYDSETDEIIAQSRKNILSLSNNLIELYKALQKGYSPPRFITEEEYQKVRQNIKEYSPEYVGFVGFGSSFGGKWFGGYGKSKKPNGEIR